MMKRTMALIMAGLLAVGCTACAGSVTTADDTPGSAVSGTPEESKDSAPLESPNGKPVTSTEQKPSGGDVLGQTEDPIYRQVLLQVGDYQVTYGVYRHYYYLLAKEMMGGDKDYFTKNPAKLDELQALALEQCKITAAYFNLAKKAGIALPDEQTLDAEFKEFVDEYEELFPLYYGMTMAEYMENNAMTLSTYKTFYLIDTYLSNPVAAYLADEKNGMLDLSDAALEKVLEDWRCVKHILVGYNDGLSDEDALKLANDLRDRLKAGEDVDALMKQYSNDYQQDGQNAYTFTYNQMVIEFEETAFSMDIGAVSDPVKSTYGYHVIVRLPIDKEAFKKEQFLQAAANAAFIEYTDKQTVSELSALSSLKHEDLMK